MRIVYMVLLTASIATACFGLFSPGNFVFNNWFGVGNAYLTEF